MSTPHSRRAHSYVRFSHPRQSEGGSLKRQLALSVAYCERNGLVLDESLTLHDLGVSAFRGANAKQGYLAAFLEACRIGRVPEGSVLIVESVDRISRQGIDEGYDLCKQILKSGVHIVTLAPEREYGPESVKGLTKGALELLIILERAHEESLMKSHRGAAAWRQSRDKARAGGGPMPRECPAWLERTPEGFTVKPAGAAAVRRIFQLCREGCGVEKIADLLTAEQVPALGRSGHWVTAYVWRILTGPSAMGTYQPCRREGKKAVPDGPPIPKYYPEVITAEEWQEAQAGIQRRSNGQGAGRRGREEANLFTGLVRCAKTGRRMQLIHAMGYRAPAGPRKRYVYLASTRENGSADRGESFDYPTFEKSILSRLKELKAEDITDTGTGGTSRDAEIDRRSKRLLTIDSELERTRKRRQKYEEDDYNAFLDVIEELVDEKNQLIEELSELERDKLGHQPATLGEAKSLIDLLAQARPEEREELRRRLKARIRQLLTEIRVLIVHRGKSRLCVAQLWFRSGKRRDYVIPHIPDYRSGKARANPHKPAPVPAFDSETGQSPYDLRRPEDVGEMEAALLAMDL